MQVSAIFMRAAEGECEAEGEGQYSLHGRMAVGADGVSRDALVAFGKVELLLG